MQGGPKKRRKIAQQHSSCNGIHICDVSDDGWVALEAVLSQHDVEILKVNFVGLTELYLGGAINCGPERAETGEVLGKTCIRW